MQGQVSRAGCPSTGWTGIADAGRGLLLDAQKGFASMIGCTQVKEFALAH